MSVALSLRNISKSFDGHPALERVSVDVDWGKVHALLGENGAGKSTLMNIVAGLYAQDAGTITFDDAALSDNDPVHAKRLGIGMVHQHFKLVRPFTVAENVVLANARGPWKVDLNEAGRMIRAQAEKLGFELDPDARIDRVSVAEQQRAEIVKVLLSGARLLILDEPTAVLTDTEARSLLSVVRRLAEAGTAVVLITHKLHEIAAYTDVVTVMRKGHNIATAESRDMSSAKLTEMMIGSSVAKIDHRPAAGRGLVLEVDSLDVVREDGTAGLNSLSFGVRGGEIYGVAGVGGNGQTELAAALVGLVGATSGTIRLDGADLSASGPGEFRRRGLSFVPAERKVFGLAEDLSVAHNYAIRDAVRGAYGRAWRVRRGQMAGAAQNAIDRFKIAGATPATRAGLLSGGNAQKLVLARELDGDFRLLVVHSPTRGLDVRACAAVHRILLDARDRGAGVVLISEDLDEILTVADRIGVINRGRIVGEFDAPADRQRIGALMVGHA